MEAFIQRVSTLDGLKKEMHLIDVKLAVGALHRAEDSYMWPYIVAAVDAFKAATEEYDSTGKT